MKTTTTFSAHWYVENNPKQTGKHGRHIKHAKNKNLDYFICSQNQTASFNHKINLEFKDLPSLPHLKNLTNFCKSRDTVFLKFGGEIQSDAFLNLATIWTSKILLFEKILDHTDADYLMWIDCVKEQNLDLITSSDSDRCCINQYRRKWKSNPFGGLLKNAIPSVRILAQVIKIPRHMVSEFTRKYIECLQFVDHNFSIYDEEVVLTIMHQKHPDLFNIC
tara:strand:+ start:604 stop:1263 length:660 start_codon:yes stop_codon:yes gene_type:complete